MTTVFSRTRRTAHAPASRFHHDSDALGAPDHRLRFPEATANHDLLVAAAHQSVYSSFLRTRADGVALVDGLAR
jgi:hypothetical protein